jgi:hypothetical protein
LLSCYSVLLTSKGPQAETQKMIRFENQDYSLRSPAPSQDSSFPTAQCFAFISHLSNYEACEIITRGDIEVYFLFRFLCFSFSTVAVSNLWKLAASKSDGAEIFDKTC